VALRVRAEALLFGVPEDTQRQLLAAPQVRRQSASRPSPNRQASTHCLPTLVMVGSQQLQPSERANGILLGVPVHRRSSPAASAGSSSPLPRQTS